MEEPVRILVVDDYPDTVRGTKRALAPAGHSISGAGTVTEALEAIHASPPDLILLDRRLPDGDGLELCRKIKADPDLAGMFVVIVSAALTSGPDQVAGLAAGADGYISRPIGNDELNARVEAFVRILRLSRELRAQADALKRRNDDLTRITEQAAADAGELKAANASLRQSRQAALNLLNDSVQAAQRLEAAQKEATRLLAESVRARRALLSAAEDQQTALVSLAEANADYANLLATTPDGFWTVGDDARILDVNANYCQLSGYTRAELLGMRLDEIVMVRSPEDTAVLIREIAAARFGRFDTIHRRKDGSAFQVEVSASHRPPTRGSGKVLHAFMRDITARNEADASLRNSLLEKEALLKEVHHRVKNNLQVIISLLRLEDGRTVVPGTKGVLRNMQGRIHSMALLHEALYRSGNFAEVELGAYLKDLATQLLRGQSAGQVQLRLELAEARVTMDQAIPCGLIVNELMTNSLKHGFPPGVAGELRVAVLVEDGFVRLRVADTGSGLPAGFDLSRSNTLGLQLVSDLTRQLGGKLEAGRGPGTEISLRFPLLPTPTAASATQQDRAGVRGCGVVLLPTPTAASATQGFGRPV